MLYHYRVLRTMTQDVTHTYVCHALCLLLSSSRHVWRKDSRQVSRCLTLQHTARHCKTLQHTSSHCNRLQQAVTDCNRLQHTTIMSRREWKAEHALPQEQTNRTPHRCVILRHTATHNNTLQHTATHCNTLQHTATHCNTLQHTLLGTNMSWPSDSTATPATHCNTLQHTTKHCNTLQHTATHCSSL